MWAKRSIFYIPVLCICVLWLLCRPAMFSSFSRLEAGGRLEPWRPLAGPTIHPNTSAKTPSHIPDYPTPHKGGNTIELPPWKKGWHRPVAPQYVRPHFMQRRSPPDIVSTEWED